MESGLDIGQKDKCLLTFYIFTTFRTKKLFAGSYRVRL